MRKMSLNHVRSHVSPCIKGNLTWDSTFWPHNLCCQTKFDDIKTLYYMIQNKEI